ncbi:SCAN domain-containing protein 3, partial [Trichinella patagoniensis]
LATEQEQNLKEEEMRRASEDWSKYRKTFRQRKVKARALIRQMQRVQEDQPTGADDASLAGKSARIGNGKLPELRLQQFSGEVLEAALNFAYPLSCLFSRDFVISVDFRLSEITSIQVCLATHNREHNGFITFRTAVVAYRLVNELRKLVRSDYLYDRLEKEEVKYIKYGFVAIEKNGVEVPQCVVCLDTLSNDAIRPTRLQRHLHHCHSELSKKPVEYFCAKRDSLSQMRLDKKG